MNPLRNVEEVQEKGVSNGVKVFFGLGNPGRKYIRSRHNPGFRVINIIGNRNGIRIRKKKFNSLIGEGTIDNSRVWLVKPQTYMNLSGEAVRKVIDYLKIGLDEMMVIVDDTNLSLGMVRIRRRGGGGGHQQLSRLSRREMAPRRRGR